MSHITPQLISEYTDKVDNLLFFAAGGAEMTTNKYDDKIVELCQHIVSVVKHNNKQPYMAQLLDLLYHLTTGTEHEVENKLKYAVAVLSGSNFASATDAVLNEHEELLRRLS